jgi:hypothetical protein
MAVNSASPRAIAANIGFDEAEMYSRMSTVRLRDLEILKEENDPEHKYNITPPGATREERVDALLAHLTQVMKDEIEADCYMFPLLLKYDVKEPDGSEFSFKKIFRVILNDLAIEGGEPGYGAFAPLAAESRRMLTWLIDGEEVYIDAPPGYGVPPFLKVGKLLEIIFEEYDAFLRHSNREIKPKMSISIRSSSKCRFEQN